MSLLSISDARIFLERLGVGDLDHSEHSLQNLTCLLCAFQENIPFQSVSIMSVSAEDRCVPSLEEVVVKGLALEGGVCFDLNVFMCILLRALGYQADVLDGSYSAAPSRHTHVVVLVHNIRYPGDRHIVDVGTGFPFLEPVPVDELPIRHCWAGLEVRYVREGDHVYRCHKTGDLLEDEKHVMRGEWRQVFDFSLQPVEYDFFRPYMEHVYVEEDNCFLKTVRACRFPRVSNWNKKDGVSCQHDSINNSQKEKLGTLSDKLNADSHHLLAVKDKHVLQGPMNNLKIEDIGVDDLGAQLEYHFPNLPSSKINVAINRYRYQCQNQGRTGVLNLKGTLVSTPAPELCCFMTKGTIPHKHEAEKMR